MSPFQQLPVDQLELCAFVVGRKSWMSYGSDTHAETAAAVFSVIASCRLHGLDPFQYFEEVLRILPYWPQTVTSSSHPSTGARHATGSDPTNSRRRSLRSWYRRQRADRPRLLQRQARSHRHHDRGWRAARPAQYRPPWRTLARARGAKQAGSGTLA
jgi:hypothetical protein